jgi:hypothetical protein
VGGGLGGGEWGGGGAGESGGGGADESYVAKPFATAVSAQHSGATQELEPRLLIPNGRPVSVVTAFPSQKQNPAPLHANRLLGGPPPLQVDRSDGHVQAVQPPVVDGQQDESGMEE